MWIIVTCILYATTPIGGSARNGFFIILYAQINALPNAVNKV